MVVDLTIDWVEVLCLTWHNVQRWPGY